MRTLLVGRRGVKRGGVRFGGYIFIVWGNYLIIRHDPAGIYAAHYNGWAIRVFDRQ